MNKIELIALEDIPLINEGDNLVEIILIALEENKVSLNLDEKLYSELLSLRNQLKGG